MSVELSTYLHHFQEYDMTDEQKMDYLRSIETIMQGFVDEAFGMETSQLILGTKRKNDADPPADAVKSNHSATPPFNDAAQ